MKLCFRKTECFRLVCRFLLAHCTAEDSGSGIRTCCFVFVYFTRAVISALFLFSPIRVKLGHICRKDDIVGISPCFFFLYAAENNDSEQEGKEKITSYSFGCQFLTFHVPLVLCHYFRFAVRCTTLT